MKKLIIPFLMLCIGYAGITRAANTDISGIDNVIYISPFSVAQGTQVNLSFKMKNTASIRGFQFDLYLPDGMTVVKSSKGRIQGALTEARLPEEDEHDLTFSEQADGAIRFLCSSQYDETFTGNDGEIASMTVSVAADMPLGNHPILLKTMKLTETDISRFYETEQVENTVTVTAAQNSRVILDENSTTAPTASDEAVDVRVKRTIAAGNWSTICLPFAMTASQITAAFGTGVQLADFTGVETTVDGEDNIVGLTINFSDVAAIEANHPYIIKVTSPVTEFTVDGVEVDPDVASVDKDEFQLGSGKPKDPYRYIYNSFIGTYVAQTELAAMTLFLNNNKFYYSTGLTKMKGYRAYFDFYDVLSEVEEAEVKMFVNVDGEETRIENLNVNDNLNGTIFDLSGRRLGNTPQKGVYIVNGKKVMK